MAWTAPMTAVANTAFTAAQFNTHVRDNLNATAPALASTAGTIFVGTGVNAIAERVPTVSTVTTSQNTTSSAYTDLTTVGPTVTVTTGTKALALYAAVSQNTGADVACFMAPAVSGATTVAANDQWAIINPSRITDFRIGATHMFTGLTAGSNTFTCKYRTPAGTASFANRELIIIPL